MRPVAFCLCLAGCGPSERPRDGGGATAAPATAAPAPETAAPLPPVPSPTRPFAAGDEIPEGFAREPEGRVGHDAFRDGVPIPWRCKVLSRTKTTIAARCKVTSGMARAYYQRLAQGFGRDMYGGRWNEEEQFAYFARPLEKGARIDLSSDRDEALYGAVTNGAELRVQHEPAGAPNPDPPPAADATADDLFLRAFGQWRCGEREVFVGVRRIVFATREADTVCASVSLEKTGGGRVRVRCSAVTGDADDVLPAGTPARWTGDGFGIELRGETISVDGTGCRRGTGRR